MSGVPSMWFAIVLIDAAAAEESLEALLIGSLVDGQVALSAFEVPCRLLKGVFVRSLWALLLYFKELLDGAGSCELLSHWLVGS